jgi:hypothetical protein
LRLPLDEAILGLSQARHEFRVSQVQGLGHSYKPISFFFACSVATEVMRDPALGLVHMNPGACGHNGWHIARTLLRFTVEGGKISGVQAIELGPRGRRNATGKGG